MSKTEEKVADVWAMCTNPLRGLTQPQVDQLLDNARKGNDVKLQQAYSLIEQTMPIFTICIEKRISGILGRKWKIRPINDSNEALEQARRIQEIFDLSDMKPENSLTDAIRHLVLASFRGRSVVKPFFDEDGLTWKKIDNWHILRIDNKFWWNPTADMFNGELLKEVPKDEICYVLHERPIDMPGMSIYLRQYVGETKWAKFVERQGIPQVIVMPPEGTPDTEIPYWNNKVQAIYAGGSGTLPNGSKLMELTSARGQDPFSNYCQHQMEMIAILATGGAINTIGGSTGMGSNLSEVQERAFESLISQDCRKIANAFTNSCIPMLCRKLNEKQLCRFEFVENESMSVDDYITIVGKLHQSGIQIDVKKLKERTGLDFIDTNYSQEWSPEKSEYTPKSETQIEVRKNQYSDSTTIDEDQTGVFK